MKGVIPAIKLPSRSRRTRSAPQRPVSEFGRTLMVLSVSETGNQLPTPVRLRASFLTRQELQISAPADGRPGERRQASPRQYTGFRNPAMAFFIPLLAVRS